MLRAVSYIISIICCWNNKIRKGICFGFTLISERFGSFHQYIFVILYTYLNLNEKSFLPINEVLKSIKRTEVIKSGINCYVALCLISLNILSTFVNYFLLT